MNWIKWRKTLRRELETITLQQLLGISPRETIGLLLDWFCWVDDVTLDGRLYGATRDTVDALMGIEGFSDAMMDPKISWLAEDENGVLYVPNFERHMSKSAKKRALATVRKQSDRSRNEWDKSGTREEKRREDKKTRSSLVARELESYLEWFNRTATFGGPNRKFEPNSTLARQMAAALEDYTQEDIRAVTARCLRTWFADNPQKAREVIKPSSMLRKTRLDEDVAQAREMFNLGDEQKMTGS